MFRMGFTALYQFSVTSIDEMDCKIYKGTQIQSKQRLMQMCFHHDNLCYTIHKRTKTDLLKGCSAATLQSQTAAPLLTPESRQFVFNILSETRVDYVQSNRDLFSVRVGLSRFRTGDAYLDSMYRFMWWNSEYKTILYDPSLQQYEPEYEAVELNSQSIQERSLHFEYDVYDPIFSYESKVTLELLPSGKMMLEKSFNPNIKASRKLCETMKLCPPKSWDVCVSMTDKRLHRNIKLKIAGSRKPWSNKLKVKNCGDRYVVQMFHSCKLGNTKSRRSEDDMSDLGIPLYRCTNGLRIHYTDTCNGWNDCLDNSDEDLCEVPDHLINDSMYKCGDSQQMLKADASRCDGKLDCFNQGKVLLTGLSMITPP